MQAMIQFPPSDSKSQKYVCVQMQNNLWVMVVSSPYPPSYSHTSEAEVHTQARHSQQSSTAPISGETDLC